MPGGLIYLGDTSLPAFAGRMSDAPRKPPRLPDDPAPAGPPDPPEPPPRDFHFKSAEYERVNRPADQTSGNKPVDVAQLYRAAAGPAPQGKKPAAAENEVHGILRANLAAENAKGLNQVVVKKRPSRRKRDYWLLLVSWNLLVAVIVIGQRGNHIVLTLGVSAAVFVSVALTWIMWGIMDNY